MKQNSKGKSFTNRSKSNGKKNHDRYQTKKLGRVDDYNEKSSTDNNDLEWYVVDSNMLNDVASLPFSNRLIDQQSIRAYINSTTPAPVDTTFDTPGILTMWFEPAYGSALNFNPTGIFDEWKADPLNIAAKSVYSFVRKHNSGAANYDEVDLMEYLISMDSIYMYWSYLVRLYGVLRTYNFKNAYMPSGLVGSMGIDALHFRMLNEALPQLRNVINTLAIKMSSLAVPTVMPLFKRHIWMQSNVYMDCDDPKAQLYLFMNRTYYKYDEANGKCIALNFISGSNGLNDWNTTFSSTEMLDLMYTFGADLIDPLLYSQSIGIMSGDILKAYENNIYSFSTIGEDYTVIPQYYERLLPEIHNATVSGWELGDIVQSDNCLYTEMSRVGNSYYTNPNGRFEALLFDQERILNVPYNAPTPEDVMYATRLMCGTHRIGSGQLQLISGSENFLYFTLNRVASGDNSLTNTRWGNISAIDTSDTDANNVQNLDVYVDLVSCLHKFDWAPMSLLYTVDDLSSPTTIELQVSADISNFTVVSSEVIRRIHQSAFCGLYGIPYTLTRA